MTQGVGGGTSNIQPAMESGEFDMYPEYTGTGWNMVAGARRPVYRRSVSANWKMNTVNDLIWNGLECMVSIIHTA